MHHQHIVIGMARNGDARASDELEFLGIAFFRGD